VELYLHSPICVHVVCGDNFNLPLHLSFFSPLTDYRMRYVAPCNEQCTAIIQFVISYFSWSLLGVIAKKRQIRKSLILR